MISLEAITRNNKSKGELSAIRNSGNVPAVVYGGKKKTKKFLFQKNY